jgi:AsmA family/AsmA-like C-terminal region
LSTAVREQPIQSTKTAPLRKPSRWLRRGTISVLVVIVIIWSGDAAISLLVQHTRLRSKLNARLEAAFGRPVDVGSYGFSVWGPVLQANSVRLGEDPRFGNEYFIRADSISVGLRWWGLLRGHVELGTLSVRGASLNLVRAPDGDWNLAEWLPHPPVSAPSAFASAPVSSQPAVQFRRIDVSDSRIDFKRGYQKLAFALVNVNGSMETDARGRWRIAMTASPWRAAVLTQQPGVISVTGHIGGTSSRLRPAAIDVSWTGASISDLFRLARGDDYGIRGDVAISISAHTEPSEPVNGWVLNGMAEIRGLHRWDMAARPDNPSLNFAIHQALLDPGLSDLRVPDLLIDAPHSTARARAAFDWTTEPPAAQQEGEASDFVELTSSQIDLRDALSWLRAFHPGVPESTSLRGFLGVRARVAGWPLNISSASASLTSERSELLAASSVGPARIGPIDLRYNRGAISLEPATLTWGTGTARAAVFQIDASARERKALFPKWHLSGTADDARGIAALAAAVGFRFSRGWNLQGPFACDLLWQDSPYPWDSQPTGTISLGAADGKSRGAVVSAPFLNLPIEQIRARVEMKPALVRVALASAKAFGANWSGTFERGPSDAEWQFALDADRLSVADLDRWLDPRWRESFLDRMLPFLGSPTTPVSPEDLRANGTLSLSEFALDPLAIHHLVGNLRVAGRTIEFSEAKGQFYGGQASGLVRATLSAVPSYRAEVSISGTDAAALAAAIPELDGVSGSTFEGDLSIDAKGATRGDLIASIACKGNAQADGLALEGLDLQQALGALRASDTRISAASAAFTCAKRVIRFQRLSLVLNSGRSLIGAGSIGFDRSLDLDFQDVGPASAPDATSRAGGFRLTGDLSSPQITPLAPAARRR